ncbi:PEP-CTERM sorting domain-containing protein [Streptomyces sp. NBC_01390]
MRSGPVPEPATFLLMGLAAQYFDKRDSSRRLDGTSAEALSE